jgi:hypothetical protein
MQRNFLKLILYLEILQPFLTDLNFGYNLAIKNVYFIQFLCAFLHESVVKVHSYFEQ